MSVLISQSWVLLLLNYDQAGNTSAKQLTKLYFDPKNQQKTNFHNMFKIWSGTTELCTFYLALTTRAIVMTKQNLVIWLYFWKIMWEKNDFIRSNKITELEHTTLERSIAREHRHKRWKPMVCWSPIKTNSLKHEQSIYFGLKQI